VRPSWVEIDLDAIEHNVSAIAETVAPAEVCAVVKADGYGHGDVPVAAAALSAGATRLAVALVEEGVRLREAGIEAPVLVLSEPSVDGFADVVSWDLTPTLYHAEAVAAMAEAVRVHGGAPVDVHCKVDTGMHRVGAHPDEAMAVVHAIVDEPHLAWEGVWTHFAVAESDDGFTTKQLDALLAFRRETAKAGIEVPIWHAANTAGALARDDARLDLVRVGLGIYGLRPAPPVAPDLALRPAMPVLSRISHLQRLDEGERPSYGLVRPMPAAGTVATVPIGYADGFVRRMTTHGGEVLIGGERHPLAGTVTMDQIVVDAGESDVAIGDEVVVLGTQESAEIPAEEWADRLGTINYEIVCTWGPRLPRHYRGGSE